GADVAIWGTNETKNAAAVKDLESLGHRVFAAKCDVGDEEQVTASFLATIDALGKVDSCFANAGIGARGAAFVDRTLDDRRLGWQCTTVQHTPFCPACERRP